MPLVDLAYAGNEISDGGLRIPLAVDKPEKVGELPVAEHNGKRFIFFLNEMCPVKQLFRAAFLERPPKDLFIGGYPPHAAG